MAFINVGANLVFALQLGDYRNRFYEVRYEKTGDMTKVCQGLTVKAVSFAHQRRTSLICVLTI